MKITETQRKQGITSESVALEVFFSTLRPSLTQWDYFVNWDKVFRNTSNYEISLNAWNFLLGKEDFDNNFLNLLESNPEFVKVIPTLMVRGGDNSSRYSITSNIRDLSKPNYEFDFSKPAFTLEERLSALEFIKNTGLISLFEKGRVRNLVDYVYGVEAGLDSNARKNRSGKVMEDVVKIYLNEFCKLNGFEYVSQISPTKIKSIWGVDVPLDKKNRIYDFALKSPNRLILIEVNFYSGGGSKLKTTAEEYKSLSKAVSNDVTDFVWITDGKGWLTVKKDFSSAFRSNDYIWNLNDLNSGLLHDILSLDNDGTLTNE